MFQQIKYSLFRKAYKIFGRNSFSQAGEDMIIDFLFKTIGLSNPYYLELGVYDPKNGNNTYKFYLNGSTGVLVEADVRLIKKIQQTRPDDLILNVGVSTKGSQFADFFVFDEPSVSTFDKEEAQRRAANSDFKIVRVDKVPLITINDLIINHCRKIPDLLSIDIEGLDFEVLSELDTVRFPIPVICAETCSFSNTHKKPKESRVIDLMLNKGYMIYADTYINTIFVHTAWFNKEI